MDESGVGWELGIHKVRCSTAFNCLLCNYYHNPLSAKCGKTHPCRSI